MENASKALIIAGGILIAMMIVGLLTFGYTQIRNYQRAEADTERQQEVLEFNKRFEGYNRRSVRGYQLISLSNLVTDTNTRFTDEEGYKPVSVTVDGLSSETATNEDLNAYLADYDTWDSDTKNEFKQRYYECDDVQYDALNSRVISMHFHRLEVVND